MQTITPSYSPIDNFSAIGNCTSFLEKRVFMFCDMKSSTSIAEQIRSKSYFNLLREYYKILLEPISEFGGEIYQIVGDEIIVTWPFCDPSYNINPVKCYDAMKSRLKFTEDKFLIKYGVVPDFKASIHCGEVTVSHWGFNHKDRVFIGDVLNTASRILNYCKKTKKDLLISGSYRLLLSDQREHFSNMGPIVFRGKKRVTNLYSYCPENMMSVLKLVS